MDTLEELLELKRVRMLAETGKARKIREASKITQAELARFVGVTGVTLGSWDNGEHIPRLKVGLRWLQALDELAGATNDGR